VFRGHFAGPGAYRFTGGPNLGRIHAAGRTAGDLLLAGLACGGGPDVPSGGAVNADVYIIACASDPGIDAVRAVTPRPVLGIFRSAVAAAVARAERFGVIALVEASKARHRLALRTMGLEARLAGEVAMNLPMETLLDPLAAQAALVAAGRQLTEMGAEVLILGCTGMAHHATAIRQAVGIPVIEPTQAAAGLAIAMLLAEGTRDESR